MTHERRPPAELARLLDHNERFADRFQLSGLGPTPRTGLAILTCMDARMPIDDILGLRPGDANVIRNAGALASDDAIRSLVLSQWVLGSSAVIVLGHTGCGLFRLAQTELLARLAGETGHSAQIGLGAFDDLVGHVRRQVEHVRAHPWVRDVPVHGLVYEVETGRVRELS